MRLPPATIPTATVDRASAVSHCSIPETETAQTMPPPQSREPRTHSPTCADTTPARWCPMITEPWATLSWECFPHQPPPTHVVNPSRVPHPGSAWVGSKSATHHPLVILSFAQNLRICSCLCICSCLLHLFLPFAFVLTPLHLGKPRLQAWPFSILRIKGL